MRTCSQTFNFVLGACGAVVIAYQRWADLLFLGAVIANVVIGFVQEYKAKLELDRISLWIVPRLLPCVTVKTLRFRWSMVEATLSSSSAASSSCGRYCALHLRFFGQSWMSLC